MLFNHPAKGSDVLRFSELERTLASVGVVQGIDQSPAEAVCVEIHSTGFKSYSQRAKRGQHWPFTFNMLGVLKVKPDGEIVV